MNCHRMSIQFYQLLQRFSTWGTRTPRGTPQVHRGYASRLQVVNNYQIYGKRSHSGLFVHKICHFFVQGYNLCQIFIEGYAEGVQHDANTKRLRTPGLYQNFCNCNFVIARQSYGLMSLKKTMSQLRTRLHHRQLQIPLTYW